MSLVNIVKKCVHITSLTNEWKFDQTSTDTSSVLGGGGGGGGGGRGRGKCLDFGDLGLIFKVTTL